MVGGGQEGKEGMEKEWNGGVKVKLDLGKVKVKGSRKIQEDIVKGDRI